jgi:hypothetical protein
VLALVPGTILYAVMDTVNIEGLSSKLPAGTCGSIVGLPLAVNLILPFPSLTVQPGSPTMDLEKPPPKHKRRSSC